MRSHCNRTNTQKEDELSKCSITVKGGNCENFSCKKLFDKLLTIT